MLSANNVLGGNITLGAINAQGDTDNSDVRAILGCITKCSPCILQIPFTKKKLIWRFALLKYSFYKNIISFDGSNRWDSFYKKKLIWRFALLKYSFYENIISFDGSP